MPSSSAPDSSRGRPKPALRISETILQTARLPEMRAWYCKVLEAEPAFEVNPQSNEKSSAEEWRMPVCFFELNEDYPYQQVIGLFGFPGTELTKTPGSPGLHHMQLNAGTMEALVARHEDLAGQNIRPVRSMNHGPCISFYYADPDGNLVELIANSYATLDEHRAFMMSEAFRANVSGFPIDGDDFCKRFRAGEPIEELRKFTK